MSSAQTAVVSEQNITLPRAEYDALQEQLHTLKTQLDWFKCQLFGAKSEKRLEVDPSRQADLLAALGKDLPAPTKPETEKISYQRRKSRSNKTVTDTGLRFDDSVPVETVVLSCPELADVPENEQVLITEKVTYRLAQRPGSYVVIKTVRPVIKRKGTDKLITPPAPLNVLDKSIADVSFLAGMLVDKFTYHLPLYRQHQRLRQCGIEIARSTLTNLSSRAIELLEPIFDAQFDHILQSRTLAMDETPIKAGRKAKGKMRQGYLWPIYGEADEIIFGYTPSRAAGHVRDVLGQSFSGTLVSDGYEAYARYARQNASVTHAQCWAHTRRYFERAKEADPEAAAQALGLIGELYRIEAHIRDKKLNDESKLKYRTQHSEPAVQAFWQWCDAQCQRHRWFGVRCLRPSSTPNA
jgi:transposase